MERAILVGLALGRRDAARADESLEELARLAWSAGAAVSSSVAQEREAPDPRFLVGRGKVDELARRVAEEQADLVLFDRELSPGQQGNLEDALGVKVLDRTGLILDIFAQRARTSEGKLQVELAQLDYLLPRLVGRHAHLSRLGGGIGTRGPGEKKLEVDRRRVKRRMAVLTAELEKVRRRRDLHRKARRRAAVPVAAVVGYTNAGKSTLLHALTGAGVPREDRLFSTLDPTTRRLRLPAGGTVLLTDTVGFIRHIPHQLVAAFKATLEEVRWADLVLLVSDVSRPDHEEREEVVRGVLAEIGAAERPVVEVGNKIDLVPDPGFAARLARRNPGMVPVSARSGLGLDRLLAAIEERLATARGRHPGGEP